VKCPQRGKKKKITVQTCQSDTYRTPWNSGGLSKQTRNRTLEVPDRRNNQLPPSKSKPPLADTERNPILRERTARAPRGIARATHRGSPRGSSGLGSHRRGAEPADGGAAVERSRSFRRSARQQTASLLRWGKRTRRRFCQQSERGTWGDKRGEERRGGRGGE